MTEAQIIEIYKTEYQKRTGFWPKALRPVTVACLREVARVISANSQSETQEPGRAESQTNDNPMPRLP